MDDHMNDAPSRNEAAGGEETAGPAGAAGAAAAGRWLRRAVISGPAADVKNAWRGLLAATGREVRNLGNAPAEMFPHFTVDGHWRLLDVNTVSGMTDGHYEHGNWTAGFSLGVLWLDALGGEGGSGDHSHPVREAKRRLTVLAARSGDHTTHDLGFLFYPSFALGHQLGWVSDTGAEPALRAARQLFLRYNPRTQLIQAFGPVGQPGLAGTSTIDTMMNVPLLFWAARHGEDPMLADAARRHARTSARLYFRPDGSTHHLLSVDPVSGALRERGTFQGAAGGSCWSRGQAWAVSGFAWAYGVTGEWELLEAAERAAAYFFDHLPPNAVPPWDFTAGDGSTLDASASAAVALGCLFLAESHPDRTAAATYGAAANALLGALADNCLNTDEKRDGLLEHSCYSRPHNLGTDSATAWGDFYFGLALALAAGKIPVSMLLQDLAALSGPSARHRSPSRRMSFTVCAARRTEGPDRGDAPFGQVHRPARTAALRWRPASICSRLRPRVSGMKRAVKATRAAHRPAYSQKVPAVPTACRSVRNVSDTTKFMPQLANSVTLIAVPRTASG
jgi:unsaturated chondroitin disaccharide hydrolase